MKSRTGGYVVGERLRVTIERIVAGGAGLARGPNGVVLVASAAPGDVLEIEVESLRGGTARARIVEIIQPAVTRIKPPCPWYGVCGGCDLQHLSYDAQMDVKEAIVRDALGRIGGIELTGPIKRFAAPAPFGSRARIELHTDSSTGAVGFFARRSKQVVDIDHCMVCRPELQRALTAIRTAQKSFPPSIQLLCAPGVVHSAPPVPPVEGGSFWLSIDGIDYLVHPAGFFQSSLDLLPTMIERVVDSSGPNRGLVWDLFSGVGLFSLPLARTWREVIGVELDKRSTENAIKGAERNGIEHARFVVADVELWLGNKRQRSIVPDLVVVDPPRTGLGIPISAHLRERNLNRLTYVSCDPTTLARDLKILLGGNLEIADIAIYDLFPQTHHVETIVRLVDRKAT